ncbi:MAG TPA: gamma-glutamyltransferase, partial [Burkholderiales bacterium]|nr:gamma-glutamyltransferase [Burkholderiales bacterium]
MNMLLRLILIFLFAVVAKAEGYVAPEPSTGINQVMHAQGKHGMVSAANPLAARAGMTMLEKGGNAVDAAIAAQMVLNLVEPQSSGIGGGAFLLFYSGKTRKISAFDGRETAPAADNPSLFLDSAGNPLKFYVAVIGGKSVGVPGTLRMLEAAHRKYGRLPWSELFGPAIALCENGFPVSPRLHSLLGKDRFLRLDPVADTYFYHEDGKPKNVGEILKNPQLAAAFREIAKGGADAFYKGRIAKDIVNAVRNRKGNPGYMTLADMSGYHAVERRPVCGNYRTFEICGMPPPSSGGETVLQIMGILSNFDMGRQPESAESVHLISEAERLAFADRDRYLADPDFVRIPLKGLLDPSYLKERASLINMNEAMAKVMPGNPPGSERVKTAGASAMEFHSTSHVSIVDRDGNAVSMTTSIEDGFGSRVMVDGFLLNNELTDFSFLPEKEGMPVANRVEAGKRPRSSMSPTFVFDEKGRLYAVLGSPGGPFIIDIVAKTLVALLDWHQSIAESIALPNFGSIGGPLMLEKDTPIDALQASLEKMGHPVSIREL